KQNPENRFQYDALSIPRTVELFRVREKLENLITTIQALPAGEIEQLSARHFLEIEYTTDAPPPVDLRQQIELALPANRYRLLRISRIYQLQVDLSSCQSRIALAPPTRESLFFNIWK